MTSPDVKRSCSGIPPGMRDTVTVTVRTDSEGVVARGRGSLSPVDPEFDSNVDGVGVSPREPVQTTCDALDQQAGDPAQDARQPAAGAENASQAAGQGDVVRAEDRAAVRDEFDAAMNELDLAALTLADDEVEPNF